MMEAGPLLLFDGVCNLCSASVQWIIRRDRKSIFRFASLQSDFVKSHPLLKGKSLPDSLVLIDRGRVYVKSSAALRIARLLGFPWNLLAIGYILPSGLRDSMYDMVARKRYRWFGKSEACMIPSPELKSRFVEL